jgi:outer membrane lipoprotein-sorting protein
MRPALLIFLLALGCKPQAAAPEASLLSEVKARLAERDRKLAGYKLSTTVTEGANEAKFEFFFRSPNRMKGVITHPTQVTYSFDGEKLHQLTPANKKLMVKKMDGTAEQNILLLNRTFAPFAPEGFRAPLLVQKGVTAKKVTHPKATEAVQVTQEAKDETGSVKVSYVFRWPQLDFLEKTSETAGQSSVVRVDEEHCDEKLKLCVPKKLSQLLGGQLVGQSVMTSVELDAAIPNDAFTLQQPEGFERIEAP